MIHTSRTHFAIKLGNFPVYEVSLYAKTICVFWFRLLGVAVNNLFTSSMLV